MILSHFSTHEHHKTSPGIWLILVVFFMLPCHMPKHSIHQPISVGRSFHQKQSLHHFSSVYLCLFNKRSNNHSSETLWLALNLSMFDSLPETATFTHTIDFLRRALGSSEIHNRFLLSCRLSESTVSPPSTLVSVYPVSFTACTTSTPPPPPPPNTFFFSLLQATTTPNTSDTKLSYAEKKHYLCFPL